MILLLLKTRIKRAITSIVSMRRFNLASYSFILWLFLMGGFFFFFRVFNFLSPIEMIGNIIANRLISYSFFVFLLLLLMSNGITALSTLYQSDEVDFLHSMPLYPSDIFTLKLIETVFYSSWATLIGALPLVVAYLISFKTPYILIPLIIIPLFAFISIPSGFGVALIICLKRLNPRFSIKQLTIILGCISGLLIYIYIRTTPYTFNIPQTLDLEAINRFMEGLRVSNPYFPNEWFHKSASALSSKDIGLFIESTVLLLSGSIISLSLAFLLANLYYRTGWLSSSLLTEKSAIPKRPVLKNMPGPLNFLQKDMKIFVRSPLQWSQLLIIGVLLVFYSISIRRTPLYVRDPFWLSALALINTGFIGYITATLSLRFVFPLISLESRTWWILRSSPIKARTIFYSKGGFHFFITLIIAETVVIFSNIILVEYSLIVVLSTIITAIFSLVAVVFALSMGTIFADFTETNPAKIASGAGGLITAVINLAYIALSLFIYFIPISSYIRAQLQGDSIDIRIPLLTSSVTFILLTLIMLFIPHRIAIKRIKEIE
ncbi:hypothetical protein KAW18_14765 [candidate division WOR-3 bacterium]|nr:hypothetical protein [candidate division WOR-3 bacterium]